MKILLVNPPFHRFLGLEQDYVPLSLLAVGSKLREDGHIVHVKNFELGQSLHYSGYIERVNSYNRFLEAISDPENLVWKEFINVVDEIKPDKVGLTVMNVKYKSAQRLLEILRDQDIPAMVGGAHPTLNPAAYPGVEVFTREFENFPSRVKDLDSLPYSNFDILLDTYSPDGYGHLMSARGCPFHCRFCGTKAMWKNRVTYKSVGRILSEMRRIYDRFGTKCFTFWDETFTFNKKRIMEFCSQYSVPAQWRCDTRADAIDLELVQAMHSAGCVQMSIGVESGVDRVLKYIGKSETTKDYLKAAEILNSVGIEWKAYCIVGFPEETSEEILETLEFTRRLRPARITLSIFTPYQGTSLYDECVDLIGDNSLLSHQSPYNFFSKTMDKRTFRDLIKYVSEEIDIYNTEALKHWR